MKNYVQIISALSLGSVTIQCSSFVGKQFVRAGCLEKFCSLFINMAFFTNVIDLQAALSACLTIRDWEMLTEAVEIPENFMPLAFARLTELTVQELEVSSIMLDLFFFNSLFLNR